MKGIATKVCATHGAAITKEDLGKVLDMPEHIYDAFIQVETIKPAPEDAEVHRTIPVRATPPTPREATQIQKKAESKAAPGTEAKK